MRSKRREAKGAASKTNGREERKTEVFERTKMCKFHILGICLRGSECKYAHHVAELQMPPDLYCTKMCTTMISQGSCTNPDCRYAHTKEELRMMPSLTKKVESSDSQSGLSGASTCSDMESPLKDPIKVELSIDLLSTESSAASLGESTSLWDSPADADSGGISTTWDEFTPKSVTALPWQMQQVDEAEEGSAKCEDSFWYNSLFQGANATPGAMPYFDSHGFNSMGFMSQDFGTADYPPGLGSGYDNGMPWGWESFQGFDLSSVQSPSEGFDVPSMQSNWQTPVSHPKLARDKTEPARVSVTHKI